MAKTATALQGFVVEEHYKFDGHYWLSTKIDASNGFYLYEEVKKLPEVVLFEGRTYGQTGWNSDTGRVYFSTRQATAKAI